MGGCLCLWGGGDGFCRWVLSWVDVCVAGVEYKGVVCRGVSVCMCVHMGKHCLASGFGSSVNGWCSYQRRPVMVVLRGASCIAQPRVPCGSVISVCNNVWYVSC